MHFYVSIICPIPPLVNPEAGNSVSRPEREGPHFGRQPRPLPPYPCSRKSGRRRQCRPRVSKEILGAFRTGCRHLRFPTAVRFENLPLRTVPARGPPGISVTGSYCLPVFWHFAAALPPLADVSSPVPSALPCSPRFPHQFRELPGEQTGGTGRRRSHWPPRRRRARRQKRRRR